MRPGKHRPSERIRLCVFYGMTILALGVIAVPSGCSLTLDFENDCLSDSECGEGLVCTQGLCVLETQSVVVSLLNDRCSTLHGVEQLTPDTVLFGSLLPASGALAQFGPPMEQAVKLAVDEINDAGGLFGRPVAVLLCDSASDVDEATQQLKHMEAVGIQGVIGAASSSVTIGAFTGAAKDAGILMMSPASTSPQLTYLPDNGLLWRTVPSDATQGLVIGEYILDRDYERVAVIYIDDAYGNGLFDAIAGRICSGDTGFSCGSENFFARPFKLESATTDHANAIAAMNESGFEPDVTVLIAFPEQGKQYIDAAGNASSRYLMPDGMRDSGLFCALPETVLCQAFGTAPLAPAGAEYNSFAIRFRAKYGVEQPGTYTAQSYDALYLLAYAHVASGEVAPTGADLALGLSRLSSGKPVSAGGTDFNLGIQTLTSPGQTIDYQGASGALNFDAETGEAPAPLEAWHFNVASRQIESLGEVLNQTGAVDSSVFDTLPACPSPLPNVCP